MLTPAMGTGNGLSNFSAFVALQETELRQFIKKHEENEADRTRRPECLSVNMTPARGLIYSAPFIQVVQMTSQGWINKFHPVPDLWHEGRQVGRPDILRNREYVAVPTP
jgi:hypothetical protein